MSYVHLQLHFYGGQAPSNHLRCMLLPNVKGIISQSSRIRQKTTVGGASPEGRPEDAVADDEVEFLQVGGGSVLQHAVPLEAVVPIRQPPGDLPGRWDTDKIRTKSQGFEKHFMSPSALSIKSTFP